MPPTKFPGLTTFEQSKSVNPALHWHFPPTHLPLLLQLYGQLLELLAILTPEPVIIVLVPVVPGLSIFEQSTSVYPLLHWHLPSDEQTPLPQQLFGHLLTEPVFVGLTTFEQSKSVKPVLHWHFPSTHVPLFQQS